jgi:cobalt-zinc-cadmium efflux system membrane fusion protein
MTTWKWLHRLIATGIVAGAVVGGWLTREVWEPWLLPGAFEETDQPTPAAGEGASRLRLSPQARANLDLRLAPAQPATYWRSLQLPGMVVERPGRSNRAITSVLAAVVTEIHALPGQLVRPGQELFTLRLASESLQTAQAALYRTVRDLEINQDVQRRLRESGGADAEALFRARLLELSNEERRLQAAIDAGRQDLAARGLSAAQVQQVMAGKLLTELVVAAPAPMGDGNGPVYEVEELKVQLGEPVQAGQTLAYLANHEALDIEGKAFEPDVAALLQAAQQGWPIRATFLDRTDADWPPLADALRIRFVSSHVDPATRLVSFFLSLPNQARDGRDETGATRRIWRFRPGQRVRLRIPQERLENVFIVPQGALVREGSDAFVFRANGDLLERRPVHVVYEDQENVVLANDGSVIAGNLLAQNAAAALNRALKAQSESGAGHGHGHGHSHEH